MKYVVILPWALSKRRQSSIVRSRSEHGPVIVITESITANAIPLSTCCSICNSNVSRCQRGARRINKRACCIDQVLHQPVG